MFDKRDVVVTDQSGAVLPGVSVTLTAGNDHGDRVGLLVAILPRLAATLEALMISSFTLLVWVPLVAAAPTRRFPWTALLRSSAGSRCPFSRKVFGVSPETSKRIVFISLPAIIDWEPST